MRVAGLATCRILDEVCAAAVAGVTTRQLDEIARAGIAKAGAISSFLGYGSGMGLPPYPGVTCISVNDRVVHGIPDDRVLVDGDLVSIDFGVSIEGWHGDSARTVEIGAVPEIKHALNEATRRALWDAIAVVAGGCHVGDIGYAVEKSLGRRWRVVKSYTGHGIGTAMHMEPDVPNYGRPGRGPKLLPGMCVAIEPIVTAGRGDVTNLEDEWTVVTRDRQPAAHWEHTVAIMPAGVWVLTAADGGAAELGARGVAVEPVG